MLDLDMTSAEPGRAAFLLAATRLINELGYRGASVQRIASELNVTKGSFYHHLDAKDDLVIACYRRSFDTIADAQARGGRGGRQPLAAAVERDRDAARRAVRRARRRCCARRRCRGLPLRRAHRDGRPVEPDRAALSPARSSDGIAEGSIRPVDALIAAQALMALQNAAFDMRKWAATMPRDRAIAMYASTLLFGLFDDRVLSL